MILEPSDPQMYSQKSENINSAFIVRWESSAQCYIKKQENNNKNTICELHINKD